MEKMTKVQWYEAIKGIVEASDYEDVAGAVEFIDKQIALIEAKAEKAKAKAAEKKVEGDELRAAVEAVLTSELQTAEAILAQVEGFEDLSKAKIVSRLSSLVKCEIAEKEQIKEGSRKVMAYRIKA